MAALSQDEHLLGELFQYRFPVGKGLAGHSFGNLFLTALTNITGDFSTAIRVSSQVLAIRGGFFRLTAQNVTLEAELENRTIVGRARRIFRGRKRRSNACGWCRGGCGRSRKCWKPCAKRI